MRPGRSVDRGLLERMADALAHRGPDDRGVEVLGTVGLAHTRLAIVDPTPVGHQPMASAGGRWWVTYNGEIFNHLDLRRRLPVGEYLGGTDTETLLHLLEAWGVGGIERCNGLYAFAAVDTTARSVLLVRDRFGVKPLYYAMHSDSLWFASEMGALMSAGIPRVAKRDVLSQAVAGWANGPETPIAGIRRVLPGTILRVDLDTLSISEEVWYRPGMAVESGQARSLSRLSASELDAAVEDALRTSVRRRLMADVPVGTMCSGGIDSSLIAAFAAQELPTIHAFNARVCDQPEMDEGPWAEKVARHLGLELHTVEMTAASWRRDLVEVVRHIEYPLTHESSVPMSQIAGLARADGVKVLLSGEGADELFGGYDWIHQRAYRDWDARGRFFEARARDLYRLVQRRGLVRDDAPDPRPSGSPSVNAYERVVVEDCTEAYAHHHGARRRLEASLLSDLSLYLPHLLNRQDKSTMLRSIETRVPFLDPDVVRLCVNLPLEAKIGAERKAALRRLGRQYLPAEVSARPKIGFGFDVKRYIDGAARPEFLLDGHLRHELGLSRDQWRDAVVPAQGHGVLLLWTGEIWCRAVLEGQPTGEVEGALWREG